MQHRDDSRQRKRPIDPAEQLAQAFLLGAGYRDIEYEPDGNVPPDFRVGNTIAVEVRRLNQNVLDENGNWQSPEHVEIPLLQQVRRTLQELGPPQRQGSWYVHYRFKRPVSSARAVATQLADLLTTFRHRPRQEPFEADLKCGLHVKVVPRADEHELEFVLAGYNDRDSGGWLLSTMKENLTLLIAEKTRKVAPFRSGYGEWWLILIDMIGWGLSEFDRALFREAVAIQHDWDRVVLLDPRDPNRWFEL